VDDCRECTTPNTYDRHCIICTATIILTFPKAIRRDQIEYACLHFEHDRTDLEQEIIRQYQIQKAAQKAA